MDSARQLAMLVDTLLSRPARPFGGRRRPLVKRGAVTMTTEPVDVRWNGRPVALTPVEGALLAMLMRRTRLSWEATNTLLTDFGCCAESRDVLIHRVRRKFADIGAADPVETVRGWGIRFRTEADAQGSTSFWIGASAQATISA